MRLKFFERLFNKDIDKKEAKKLKEEDIRTQRIKEHEIEPSLNIESNINILKEAFKDCDDVVYKNFKIGAKLDSKVAIVYIDGLIDKVLVTNDITQALMQQARGRAPENVKHNLYNVIKEGNISAPEMKEVTTIEEVINAVLSGDTAIFIDGYKEIIIVSTKGWATRGISEPETEALMRGPRDGFTETIKVNMALIRRRVRDTELKVKMMQVGRRSKTDIAIMYIDDIADKRIVQEVNDRISKIDIDAVLESSYIESYIEESTYSLFPQVENTERPDTVAASLLEGRVAILVDNTPFVLIVPVNMNALFQSAEDYYERWYQPLLVRPLRYLAALVAIFAPALYIATTSFHPGILPTRLALYIAATRSTAPFPAFLEAFLMIVTMEFLREAGSRITGPLGSSIGIVGGLVIGQAAVDAGIVSPFMVIITAITIMSIFMMPHISLAIPIRILIFTMMILASILGFYGIMLGFIVVLIHLCKLSSFGVPFISPFGILGKYSLDLEDSIVKSPRKNITRRPYYGSSTDQTRRDKNNQ